jgi:hypothetical protein
MKEKQVLQLQAELDRFKLQHPGEGRDIVSQDTYMKIYDPYTVLLG